MLFPLILIFIVLEVQGQLDILLHLDCTSSIDCTQFQVPGAPNVTCLDSYCHCLDINYQAVQCEPRVNKLSNVIGGKCPCTIENSECDEEDGICYCIKDYTAVHGKRNCVKESVPLGEECDNNSQCLKYNKFSECFEEKNENPKKYCKCQSHFIDHDGSCVAAVGLNERCESNEQCKNETFNSICVNKRCVCEENHVTSLDKLKCLPGVDYDYPCKEHSQCIHTLGPGAICYSGLCSCDHKHFISASDKNHKMCELRVEIGQYCREHNHCYQYNLKTHEQTMECFQGKCHCRNGLEHNKNVWECASGTAESMKVSLTLLGVALSLLY